MQITPIHFNTTQVTTKVVDNVNRFLWLAFSKNSSGNCILRKASPFNPEQIYFSMNITVDKIVASTLNTTNIYLALEDDALFMQRRSLTNPLTSITTNNKPIGIVESPIDIIVGNYIYVLTPGIDSGTVANVIRYSTAGVFQEVIELSKSGVEVNNASSLTIDASNNLWIITNNSPVEYIRLYDEGGFSWSFEVFQTV
jgi:hypothetical protein